MKINTEPNATNDSAVVNEHNTNVVATDSNEKKDEIKPRDTDVMQNVQSSNTASVSASASATAPSTNINATEPNAEKVVHL